MTGIDLATREASDSVRAAEQILRAAANGTRSHAGAVAEAARVIRRKPARSPEPGAVTFVRAYYAAAETAARWDRA